MPLRSFPTGTKSFGSSNNTAPLLLIAAQKQDQIKLLVGSGIGFIKLTSKRIGRGNQMSQMILQRQRPSMRWGHILQSCIILINPLDGPTYGGIVYT